MGIKTKLGTKEIEKNLNLSSEFKEEIVKGRKSHNWGAKLFAALILFLMLGSVGLGAYQIFFKPETLEKVEPTEKIQSVPVESKEEAPKEEEPAPAETPAESAPAASETTQPAVSTQETYTVVEGDTLGGIAAKFDTTVSALKSLNNIEDETSLQIGQKLKLK